ncbi:MAG: hypothetical protein NT092_13560 [Bacteroidia bacterium]|nr:hypothetical protein [Bacteroidia bacterium]
MKKLIISFLSLILAGAINAQSSKTDILQNLENNKSVNQELKLTATTKAATRLFGAKDDLTTVIMVIPKGSVVDVIGSDSTYFHVVYEENDGYIFKRQAVLDEPTDISKPVIQKAEPVREPNPAIQQQQSGRFAYLENKYGTGMAAKLIQGKIWKGMHSEMIMDSWGKPQNSNRVISGNTVKEEWTYKNTWLYLENDILVEWGQLRK